MTATPYLYSCTDPFNILKESTSPFTQFITVTSSYDMKQENKSSKIRPKVYSRVAAQLPDILCTQLSLSSLILAHSSPMVCSITCLMSTPATCCSPRPPPPPNPLLPCWLQL